jgi:hypothetical protein
VRALRRQFPFQPKVTFEPRLCVGGDNRHEQLTLLNLPAKFRIPRVAADQGALIEPHFDAGRAQRVRNAARRLRVLGRVTQKHSSRLAAHLNCGLRIADCGFSNLKLKTLNPKLKTAREARA